jgi:hypothetical protein
VAAVWKDGRAVDRDRLPRTRVLSVAPAAAAKSSAPGDGR